MAVAWLNLRRPFTSYPVGIPGRRKLVPASPMLIEKPLASNWSATPMYYLNVILSLCCFFVYELGDPFVWIGENVVQVVFVHLGDDDVTNFCFYVAE